MHTTSHLTSSEEARDGFAVLVDDTGLRVDLETTHGVVQDGGHDGDVEEVVEFPFTLEELKN
jgi:hypothetical protein